jgi:hypothetical protein
MRLEENHVSNPFWVCGSCGGLIPKGFVYTHARFHQVYTGVSPDFSVYRGALSEDAPDRQS